MARKRAPRPGLWLALALLAGAGLLIGFGAPLRAAVENTPGLPGQTVNYPEGAVVYAEHCATCHDTGVGRAPARLLLGYMTPDAILAALTDGAMAVQGSALSQDQKEQVAQHISGQALGAATAALPPPKMCDAAHMDFDRKALPAFAGAGLDQAATHAIPTAQAGLDRRNVGNLTLKWAFGFPLANRARSQPALGGGAVFVGSHGGRVYALDRETGCIRWMFDAGSEVRTAIVLAPWQADDTAARPLLYFGDWTGKVHALEAFTGKEVWSLRADEHPSAVITASPALHQGTLYVGVSSLEEASAASPGYTCCTFRGSVLALDAASGNEKWRTWMVDEPVSQPGSNQLGPSGVAIWSGFAIDERRGNLIVATGDNYTQPATELSDAIVAMDLSTGAIRWHYQATEGDAWNVSCVTPTPSNCPADAGPDYDFGAIPVLARGKDGKDYVLAGQKSGIVWAVDAATGTFAWKRRVGRGGMAGGVHFGLAAADGIAFAAISDMHDFVDRPFPAQPGIHALAIATGEVRWYAAPPAGVCEGRTLCLPGNSGAISATPQLVLAGSDDGWVRIHDANSGKTLWQFDTARDFETVNGVPGKGGAISGGAAPVADQGQLLVSSGYGFVSKMPGNVLLMFDVE